MKCPFCGHLDDKVVDSRSKREGAATRRRRECLNCGERFTTCEYIEAAPLVILKSDGYNESFDRGKLKQGIVIALAKRPVSIKDIDRIVTEIEEQCHGSGNQQVTSQEIGEMVMEKLKALDEVAYIRFASVYRRFKDAGEFRKELERM
ncbi:MAG: transcriptional regulator NrdR [Candidatus Hatepunaea meridiana]|nr:transcriptional regulator NrdR [Candidatus Hatepunaea meridiana]